MSDNKNQRKQEEDQIKAFSVPFSLDSHQKNLTIHTKAVSTSSKSEVMNQAFDFHSQGKIKDAAQYYQDFIDQGFKDYRVFSNFGLILLNSGDLQKAEIYTREAISLQPDSYQAHSNLGAILRELYKLQEAEFHTRNAIEIKADSPESLSNLGNILLDLGRSEEAEKYTRKAIEIKADFTEAHYNLGNILRNLGRLKEAEISYRKAIELQPDLLHAYSNLGCILRDMGEFPEAEFYTRKAIGIDPNIAEPYCNLGNILKELGKYKKAELAFRKAIKIEPDLAKTYYNLGLLLTDLGKVVQAKEEYKNSLRMDKNNLAYTIKAKISISPIPFNQEQIDKERKQLLRQISILEKDNNLVYKGEIFSTSLFYLAYQNKYDDKIILKRLSKFLSKFKGIGNKNFNKEKAIEESKTRSKIRLGVCSDYLKTHSVSNFFGNIIKDISATDIEVIIFRGPYAKEDGNSQSIDLLASEVVRLPVLIEEATNIILSKSIDILFYPDIGMSSFTYLLSLSRLALVQVTTLGHPNSTGCNEIDYFISCDNYETKNSEKYYSEKLIKLSRIPVNYSIPSISLGSFNLSDFNIPKNSFLIGIPHSPFKFHPDYDSVLDQILKQIPNSFLFFADGEQEYQTQQLKNRWSKSSTYILDRTIFSPRVSFNDFLEVIKKLDILLDPFYFGMGNTFYQAMAFNTPVVTMPTTHIKSRHAYAGYQQMGIKNPPVAKSKEEYILLCKKLAFDKSYKNNIEYQIVEKSKDYLFNDKTIYKEYISFFRDSLKAAQDESFLKHNWSAELNKQ